MSRQYSFYATDRLEAALLRVAAQSSRNTARLQRDLDDAIEARLEEVIDDMTSDVSIRPRRFTLARWGGNDYPLARWRGEMTRAPRWSPPRPITIEVDGSRALTYAPERRRNTSAALTCLLDLVREREADLRRLRARTRPHRVDVDLDLVVQPDQVVERRLAEDALPARDATSTSEHTILAVLAALLTAVVLESTLLSGLTRGTDVLATIAGHLLALVGAVVVFFAIDRLPFWKGSADAGSAPARQRTWPAPMTVVPALLAALAIATILTLLMLAFSGTSTASTGKETGVFPTPTWEKTLNAVGAPTVRPSAQPTSPRPTPAGTSTASAGGGSSAPLAPAARGANPPPSGTDIW